MILLQQCCNAAHCEKGVPSAFHVATLFVDIIPLAFQKEQSRLTFLYHAGYHLQSLMTRQARTTLINPLCNYPFMKTVMLQFRVREACLP